MFPPCVVQLKYEESTRRRIAEVRISAERRASNVRMCVSQLKYAEKLTPRMPKPRSPIVRAGERDHEQASLRTFNEPLQNPTQTHNSGSPRVAAPTSIFVFLLENAWSQNGFES